MKKFDETGIGRIEVNTLNLPGFVKSASGTYTFSGKVLLDYHRDDDPNEKDYIHIATMNDDGSDFRDVFAGVIPIPKTANGMRYMPFSDNKRILLGDYVLECEPDIDSCKSVRILSVKYPWGIDTDPLVWMHWSEVIIAPDNEHICWTTLYTNGSCSVSIGALRREDDRYTVIKSQIISSAAPFITDEANEGYIIPQPIRGGEVKQFVRGGTAISQVGNDGNSVLPASVIQDLLSDKITRITILPGYEETTILSPDEKLGIVMSTRNSPGTNCAILGLMPRPHAALTMQALYQTVYLYAVAGARFARKSNIGPVLIDIERSQSDPDYIGIPLNDPEENWVYYSPMSWHPSGKKVMWPEKTRGGGESRICIAEFLEYQPNPLVPAQRTPDNILYAASAPMLSTNADPITGGKIAGKCSGYIDFQRDEASVTESRYEHYSDDDRTVYNGFERIEQSQTGEVRYEADLEASGENIGEMKMRLVFSAGTYNAPPKLVFAPDKDGEPMSSGYAMFNGIKLDVRDMFE